MYILILEYYCHVVMVLAYYYLCHIKANNQIGSLETNLVAESKLMGPTM